MRICLIGHFEGYPDEGVKNIAFYLAHYLAKQHQVRTANIRDLNLVGIIRDFRPHLIHYILSPTRMGLIATKILSFVDRGAKTVISAPNPYPFSFRWLMSLFKPDLMLAQSEASQKIFEDLGCKTLFLPNGVDTERFIPVSGVRKAELREKYAVDKNKFVILHVGSIRRERNLPLVARRQSETNQVVIIGKRSDPGEKELLRNLEQEGCLIWTDYLEHMEELYALSDCYIFPTTDRNCCAESPLSVMEAMSCNLPVVSTRFGALPQIFHEGDGLIFVNEESDLVQAIDRLKNGSIDVKTRDKVLVYSWENIARQLDEIYEQVLG